MEALQVILRVSAQYWTAWMSTKSFRIQCEALQVSTHRKRNHHDSDIKLFEVTNITMVD